MKTRMGQISLLSGFLITIAIVMLLNAGRFDITHYQDQAAPPRIEPDYSGIVIPPNIAPMNFKLLEEGERFLVKIYTDSGDTVRIRSRSPLIKIPGTSWKNLLNRKGKALHFETFIYHKKWIRYQRFTNQIADVPIDRYLVYRLLRPNYTVQHEMQIRQRDLESFDESCIMTTRTVSGCVNCHAFNQNNPDQTLFHLRWGSAAGTMIAKGKIVKVDTRTAFNQSPGTYPAWHPDGNRVAFSVNQVRQFYHAVNYSRDVIDLASDIIIYHTESNTVSFIPEIASPDFMETYPNWSPDGRYLYFSSAPQIGSDFELKKEYRDIRYHLMRIAFDPATGIWGEPEMIVSSSEIDLSCTQPRVSPDGKYIMFTAAEYGNFPIFLPGSDLYIMDLDSRKIRRIDANSDASEGHHAWSLNSRWIVFTSKRDNGLFTRLYIGYTDEEGTVSKPFILPLKNPEEYRTLFRTFSVPELIIKPVPYRLREFVETALEPEKALQAKLQSEAQFSPDPDSSWSESSSGTHLLLHE